MVSTLVFGWFSERVFRDVISWIHFPTAKVQKIFESLVHYRHLFGKNWLDVRVMLGRRYPFSLSLMSFNPPAHRYLSNVTLGSEFFAKKQNKMENKLQEKENQAPWTRSTNVKMTRNFLNFSYTKSVFLSMCRFIAHKVGFQCQRSTATMASRRYFVTIETALRHIPLFIGLPSHFPRPKSKIEFYWQHSKFGSVPSFWSSISFSFISPLLSYHC